MTRADIESIAQAFSAEEALGEVKNVRSARLANLADDRFKGTLLPQLLEPLGFQRADTESAAKLDLLMD